MVLRDISEFSLIGTDQILIFIFLINIISLLIHILVILIENWGFGSTLSVIRFISALPRSRLVRHFYFLGRPFIASDYLGYLEAAYALIIEALGIHIQYPLLLRI